MDPKKCPSELNGETRVHLRDQEALPSPGSLSFSFSIVAENRSKIKDTVPPGTWFTGISQESDEELVDFESVTKSASKPDG